jgi:hypothetical protein
MEARATKVTLAFTVLGVLAWLAVREVTTGGLWPLIALVTVGVLVPQLINGHLRADQPGEER